VGTNIEAATELRAGGTDLSERRRSGLSVGPIDELKPPAAIIGITWTAARPAHEGCNL
jgi:xanthine dehydrogenase YagS FAD-binding subunit